MSHYLVSIIMPAYNGEKFIDQAINSVIDQTYDNWELIVIDDGSQDGTKEIVQNYKDPRIRYFYQYNQGQAAALNKGLDLARGEFITTLDVDDWYTPTSLEDRIEFLISYPQFGAVYADGYYCDIHGNPIMLFLRVWLVVC